MMVYRALLALTLVLCLTQALPVKKANDLSKEIADVAKENTKIVKRSEELVQIGNHQNAPRTKKDDPTLKVKDEQNRDENGKIVIKENEIDKTKIVDSSETDNTPLETEAMEKAVMDLAKVADTPSDDDLEEKVKVVEEEKEIEKLPKEGEVEEDKETEQDEVFQPQDIFRLGAREEEVNDVNSDEVPDEESEVLDSSEEVPPEALMTANMEMAQDRPAGQDYQYDEDYNSLYSDPYRWLDRKKRDANRQKREALQGSEAGMSMAANEEDTKSRSKRDTEYPLSLNDLYNLYYKYKALKDEEEAEEEAMEPVYEVPEYEDEYGAEAPAAAYDYGVEQEMAPPSEEWEPEAVNNAIQEELQLEAMMQPSVEAEAPYYQADVLPEDIEEELEEEEELPAWEVPSSESAYYNPMEYAPVSRPMEDEYVPNKRTDPELLSLMPGIKRGDDFYPAYTEEQEPWQALIPPAAEKRGVMEEYARLYRLARALKRSREDSVEDRWESLLGEYKKK